MPPKSKMRPFDCSVNPRLSTRLVAVVSLAKGSLDGIALAKMEEQNNAESVRSSGSK